MTGFTAAFPTHLKALKVTTTAEEEEARAALQTEFLMFAKLCLSHLAQYLFLS